jgi:hypothetical protein
MFRKCVYRSKKWFGADMSKKEKRIDSITLKTKDI